MHNILTISRNISTLRLKIPQASSGTLVAIYQEHETLHKELHMSERMCSNEPHNPKGELTMENSTKNQAEGKFHQAKGAVKEVAGKLTDNPKLESEGVTEKITGKVQEKIGQIEKILGK
jgi:uncharacterized protein YjbJ (UPF0337 family)